MHRILYLGLDPSRYQYKGTLVHYPIIQTIPVEQLDSTIDWKFYSHILFTSPTAVKHWMALSSFSFEGKAILSIGPSTSAVLKSYGLRSEMAPFATQEGVVEMLKRREVPFLFWPRSSKARAVLVDWLQERQACYQVFDLYRTVSRKVEPLPNLEEFDEVVFTSPSTVKAFLEIYGPIPAEIKTTSIGPVTQNCLTAL